MRAAWRLCVFGAAMMVLQPIVESVLAPSFAALTGVVGARVEAYPWITLATTFAAMVVALRFVDRAPWSSVALDAPAWRARVLGVGFAVGTISIAATVLLLTASGSAHLIPVRSMVGGVGADALWTNASWSATAWRLTALLAPAALWEELLFRGYLWTVARDAGGVVVARWATAVAFGAVHLMNPGAGVQSTVLVVVAGFALGLIRERTGSLAATWLAHFAWNWVMAAVLHMPVSGVPFETPGYRIAVDGPTWWTGGAWGPEGGVAALTVMLIGLAIATRPVSWWQRTRSSRTETLSS